MIINYNAHAFYTMSNDCRPTKINMI